MTTDFKLVFFFVLVTLMMIPKFFVVFLVKLKNLLSLLSFKSNWEICYTKIGVIGDLAWSSMKDQNRFEYFMR